MRKTVILGDCRTGTHLLASTLGQHPDIRSTREVFSPWKGRKTPAFTVETFQQLFASHDVVMVQRYQVKDIAAIQQTARCIVSLTRDPLEQYRSWRTAIATDHWHQDHPLPTNPEAITIRFRQAEYDRWFCKIRDGRKQIRFNLPTLQLRYSGLKDSFAETIERVLAFTGAAPMQLPPAIQPTPRHPCHYVGWPL